LDKSLIRPAEVDLLVGDATKAQRVLGWQPSVGFRELIEMMVYSDLDSESRAMRAAAL
jgi:GDPmannose 4,6-dehydratase